ncbi:CYTH domain-containing protein [Streptococcus sanguinis]|uniref:CYTH domain-containing protein n=1 Tax=Streptococcus sanguinis TaxID=1305 RepID=UPI000FBA3730|nr:CYTH domain-containing protein [Streptococcus sanguinis]RSI10748.1 CYTH domain protein [Streptococcus sanguinis]
MIEKEYKIVLTQSEYLTISKKIKFDDIIHQTNYYYDSNTFDLERQGLTVRVRIIEGKGKWLQVKKKLQNKTDGITIKKEFEEKIGNLPRNIRLNHLESLIQESIDTESRKVVLLGEMTTTRMLSHSNNCEIALDRSEYLGKTDYELEIEFEEDADSVKKILKDLKIQGNIKEVGKYRRFLKELKRKIQIENGK